MNGFGVCGRVVALLITDVVNPLNGPLDLPINTTHLTKKDPMDFKIDVCGRYVLRANVFFLF